MRILDPADVTDMNDDYQRARLIKRDDHSCTVELQYRPFYRPPIAAEPNWRQSYAGMTAYLSPTASENWDSAMQRDLFDALKKDGIFVDTLSDKEAVERVAKWAIKRAQVTSTFIIWTLYYPRGVPEVFPQLKASFDFQCQKLFRPAADLIEEEAEGRSMYYRKIRGSCTSTAIYVSTVLRAIGIPTRVILCIPPFDPNDKTQVAMFNENIHDDRVLAAVHSALSDEGVFYNHVLNEVYVGHQWMRLNSYTLNPGIVDRRALGVMIHIRTAASVSDLPLAATWGRRFFQYPGGQPELSSVNPYQLLTVHDSSRN